MAETTLAENRASGDRLTALEGRIGYTFKDRGLLEQALTHASAVAPDDARSQSYQRLEFLGDRVLGLAVARMLYDRFPSAAEGTLSRALADLVRKETCAAVAADIGLGPAIRVGKGERRNGLAKKIPVLGDACEALLGAIAVDGGHDAANAVVNTLWAERLPVVENAGADPKTALQEWAHTRGLATPVYVNIARAGPDHAPRFSVAARIEGLADATGEGTNKRAAERAAALAMLERESKGP